MMILLSENEKAEISRAIWHKLQNGRGVVSARKRGARDLDNIRRCYVKKFIRQREGGEPEQASVEQALNAYFTTI